MDPTNSELETGPALTLASCKAEPRVNAPRHVPCSKRTVPSRVRLTSKTPSNP